MLTQSYRSTRFGSSILSVIKYVWSYRVTEEASQSTSHPCVQLTKVQLASVLPLLVHHLGSSNYVCYTYAAITIERILFMKSGKTAMCVLSPRKHYLD